MQRHSMVGVRQQRARLEFEVQKRLKGVRECNTFDDGFDAPPSEKMVFFSYVLRHTGMSAAS